MTPEEIALLLSLPESSRARLAEVPGPGWLCSPALTSSALAECPGGDLAAAIMAYSPQWAWCPADTFAICLVARSMVPAACDLFIESTREDWYQAGVGYPADGGKTWTRATGETPRLAALRLLAIISKP